MNSIQTLVAELKQKLTYQARTDLERMIATPEAQAILARDEGEQLENRRVLVAAMKMAPGKYAKEKQETAKIAAEAAARVAAAETALAEAKVAFGAASAAASVPGWRENAELFAMERELLAGCDPRLDEFAAHCENLAQIVGHSVVIWPMHLRNWITRERSVVYESNTAEVTSLRKSLAEAAAECRSMRMEAIGYQEVTNRLAVWTETLCEPLRAFSLPCPRIDEAGAVKLDGERLTATAMTERAISTARGIGKRAITA